MRHLGQAIDVGLPGPEVAALDGVVKQPPDAVAVVAIILGGIDAALGRDAVGPPGAVLDAEGLDVVAQFRQGGRGGAAGQAGAHHDDLELSLVGRVDQLQVETMSVPLRFQGSARNLGIKLHQMTSLFQRQNDERQRAEAERHDHGKDNAQLLNKGHVLGMIGSHRLKGAPEAVPDMKGDDEHAEQINCQE